MSSKNFFGSINLPGRTTGSEIFLAPHTLYYTSGTPGIRQTVSGIKRRSG